MTNPRNNPRNDPRNHPNDTRIDDPIEHDSQRLQEAIRDTLTPHAVAAIVAYLQPARSGDADVDRELQWFTAQLIELLGGPDGYNRLIEELGL